MANATKDRGHRRNCRARLLLMSAMAVVSLCATVSRAAAEGVGSEEIELEDIAEEIAAFEEEEELAASRMKAEKESPTPSDNLPPTPATAPVISNSITVQGAGHGTHSTREDAHVYHEKVQNIRNNLANKAARWTTKLRESKDAGHHMDIHVEIAAFKEEEEPAAARMEPEKQDSPPSSRASPPPLPVPAPVISEAIKLDGEGASSTNEDTQAFDEKLQKMRDSLAGKAASRAAKLRETKNVLSSKMASSMDKVRQRRKGHAHDEL